MRRNIASVNSAGGNVRSKLTIPRDGNGLYSGESEKRTTALENEKNFIISLEREELWLSPGPELEFRSVVRWVKAGSAWDRGIETEELSITVWSTQE